ncbi:MAG: hypothetical protein AB7N76_23620 [Planctomycetota bacterium]
MSERHPLPEEPATPTNAPRGPLPAGLLAELCGLEAPRGAARAGDPARAADPARAGDAAHRGDAAWREALGAELEALRAAPPPPPEVWAALAADLDRELAAASLAPSLAPRPEEDLPSFEVAPRGLPAPARRGLLLLAAALLLATLAPLTSFLRPEPDAPRLAGEVVPRAEREEAWTALRALCPQSGLLDVERVLVLDRAARAAGIDPPSRAGDLGALALALAAASVARRAGDEAQGRELFATALLAPDLGGAAPPALRDLEDGARARLLSRAARARAYLAAVADLAPELAPAARAHAAAAHLRWLHARARGLDDAALAPAIAWRAPALRLEAELLPAGATVAERAAALTRVARNAARPGPVLPPLARLRAALAAPPGEPTACTLEGEAGVLLTRPLAGGLALWWLPSLDRREALADAAALATLEGPARPPRLRSLARATGAPADGALGRIPCPAWLRDAPEAGLDALTRAAERPGEALALRLGERWLVLSVRSAPELDAREQALEGLLALSAL